jgi:hypothetical protein
MTHDDHFDDFPSDHDDHHGDEAAHDAASPVPASPAPETEEWESFDENAGGDGGVKKKPLGKIIIGGAVALAVVIVLLKMGGSAPRPASHTAPHATPVTAAKTPAAAIPAPATEAAAKPALKLPPTREDVIYGAALAGGGKTDATAATPALPQTGFLNDPNALKKVERIQAEHVPDTAADNAGDEDKVPALGLKPVTPAPAMPATPITPVAALPAPAAKTAEPVKLPESVASMPTKAAAPDTDARLKDITAQLATITTQLQDLQANTVRKTEFAAVQTEVAALKDQAAHPSTAVESPAPATATPARHTAHKTVRHPASHPAAAHARAATHWTLKSAQPGIAIVDPGDGKLVTVQAGDHLPGLGTVKSVAQQDGQWVVTGSAGRITQ